MEEINAGKKFSVNHFIKHSEKPEWGDTKEMHKK
jgi:hypothetical protein